MDDRLRDDRLRRLGRDARAEVEAGLDLDAELAALAGRAPTELPVRQSVGRGRPIGWIAAAAAAVAVLVGGIWLLGDDTTIQTADPDTTALTATTPVLTTIVDTTVAPTPTTSAPPTSTSVAPEPTTSTNTSTTTTTTTVSTAPEVPIVDWRDLAWEGSGIEGSCAAGDPTCTQLLHASTGDPVTYESTTRVLTRHTRPEISVTLPESYGEAGYLFHAGPDDVVYLGVAPAVPAEQAVDVVAITLADGDAGREIGRWAGVANAVGDSELVPTPDGLVNLDCCGPDAVRPDPDAEVLVPWVDRNGEQIASTAPTIRVEVAYPDLVVHRDDPLTGSTRSWTYRPAGDWMPRGMPRVVPTFDGGFIAAEYGSGGTSIARGFVNGTVEQVVLDDVLFADSIDPAGRFLLGDASEIDGWFVRVDPFPGRTFQLGEQATIDAEAGTVTLPDLSGISADWLFDPVAFGDAVRGPLAVNEQRTITAERQAPTEWLVTVTTSNFFDDSVFADRWELSLAQAEDGRLSFVSGTWANVCQPGRGHQDFRADLCV